jgi:hypothetical protein
LKTGTAAALIAALIAGSADSAGASYVVYGVGTKGCDEWSAVRKLPGQTQLFESWLSGYVSGANGAGSEMTPLDVREMVDFVDQHCRSHPLDRIYEAAAQLIDTLRVQTATPMQ